VCHTCANKACVREDHLYYGTHADNMRDAAETIASGVRRAVEMRRGQWGSQRPENLAAMQANRVRGERARSAKLTEAQVLEIRRRVAAGETQRSMMREFDVSYTVIQCIVHRRTWKHI
jgi:hypothetical protein